MIVSVCYTNRMLFPKIVAFRMLQSRQEITSPHSDGLRVLQLGLEQGSEFTTKIAKSTKVEEYQVGGSSGQWATKRCDAECMVGGALLVSEQWHPAKGLLFCSLQSCSRIRTCGTVWLVH